MERELGRVREGGKRERLGVIIYFKRLSSLLRKRKRERKRERQI